MPQTYRQHNKHSNRNKHNVNPANSNNNNKKVIDSFRQIIANIDYNEFKITNKIHYNKFKYVRVIPKGKKIYVWFQTLHKNDADEYQIMYIECRNNTYRVLNEDFNICCDYNNLSCGKNGTILYGSLFTHNKTKYFNTENIISHKNNLVYRENWLNKYSLINDILTNDIKQTGYNICDLVVLNCLTYKLPRDIISLKDMVPYNIYCLQYLFNNSDKIYFKVEKDNKDGNNEQDERNNSNKIIMNNNKNNNGINKNKKMLFSVKACLNHDEYDLYKDGEFIDKAYIPDYKTSVYLNTIFRKIRENQNLDLLEESEDDEDFENIYLDKFVDLNKTHNLYFEFSHDCNMWKPVL